MKRYIVLTIAALVSIFVEGICIQWLPLCVAPHILVCLVVYLAFFEVSVFGTFFAFSLGLLADFSSGIVVGPWAGALVATYGFIALMSQRLFVHSGFVMFAAAAVASFASDVFYWLLVLEIRSASSNDLLIIVGRAVSTGLTAPILQILLNRFEFGPGTASRRIGLSSVGV